MDLLGPRQTGIGWCAGHANTGGTGLRDSTVRLMANTGTNLGDA